MLMSCPAISGLELPPKAGGMGVVESPTTPTEGILHYKNDPCIPYKENKEAFLFMVFLGRYKTHAVILGY